MKLGPEILNTDRYIAKKLICKQLIGVQNVALVYKHEHGNPKRSCEIQKDPNDWSCFVNNHVH